jgi:hypothetical protein
VKKTTSRAVSSSSPWPTFRVLGHDAFGLWGIDSEVSVTDQCPASVATAILDALLGNTSAPGPAARRSQPQPRDGIEAMRQFRDDGGLKAMPGLARWWDLVARHTPELALLIGRHQALQKSVQALLTSIGPTLENPAAPLHKGFLKHMKSVLTSLTEEGSTRLRAAASQVAVVLPQLKGKTVRQTMQFLSTSTDRYSRGKRPHEKREGKTRGSPQRRKSRR